MGADNKQNVCRFARSPLNVCHRLDGYESGTKFNREHCSGNYQTCERYETLSRILDNMERKYGNLPPVYMRVNTVG